MEPIRSELETMFYLMCWPVMLYVAGGVLTLSLCLFILGAFYAQHPNWQLVEPYVLKMNFFSEKAEGGKKEEDDEEKEEGDEDEVEVAV